MSPAKMFAYMKERESRTERQEVHKVSNSTRDLSDGGEHPAGQKVLLKLYMSVEVALVLFFFPCHFCKLHAAHGFVNFTSCIRLHR